MDDMYREIILDHYKNPRNRGRLEPADISYEDDNPLCGDRVRIDIRLEGDRVKEIAFSGQGCAISQASASMLTEEVLGKTLAEVKQIDKQEVLEMMGLEQLGPTRIKCALLSLKVLKAGVYGLKGETDTE